MRSEAATAGDSTQPNRCSPRSLRNVRDFPSVPERPKGDENPRDFALSRSVCAKKDEVTMGCRGLAKRAAWRRFDRSSCSTWGIRTGSFRHEPRVRAAPSGRTTASTRSGTQALSPWRVHRGRPQLRGQGVAEPQIGSLAMGFDMRDSHSPIEVTRREPARHASTDSCAQRCGAHPTRTDTTHDGHPRHSRASNPRSTSPRLRSVLPRAKRSTTQAPGLARPASRWTRWSRRSPGFRGVARLRTGPRRSTVRPPFTRSGLERRFLSWSSAPNCPKPSMNLFVEGYELDAYWPAERFAVELDTYDYHGDPRRFRGRPHPPGGA